MDKIKLTKRQIQILGLLKQALTNAEMGAAMNISEHTVKVHVWRLFKRIGVSSRATAVRWWAENGGEETIEQAYARGVADGRQQILDGISKMAVSEQGEQA